MNYQIRSGLVADAEQLAQIQVRSYLSAYRSLLPEAFLADFSIEEQTSDWKAMIPVGKNEVLLVAERATGSLVGYAYGRKENFGDFDCELIALHVRDSARSRGIGKTLFLETVDYFRDHGCQALVLWLLEGNPAINFYQKLGGELIGRKAWNNNAHFGVNVEELAVGWPDLDTWSRRFRSRSA